MNHSEKSLARIFFKTKIYSKNGSEFERFFTGIMNYAHKDFRQIKPQGQIGDRKNDGYIPSKGAYYQVYAPESPSQSDTPAKAAKKAAETFSDLLTYWRTVCTPKEYYFVFNDKYHGSYPEIEREMSGIHTQYNLQKCEVFLAKNLEDTCFSRLDDSQLVQITGFIPPADEIRLIDYSSLSEIIGHIMKNFQPIDIQNWQAAEFDGKITYNNLSDEIKPILDTGFQQCRTLETYFENNSDFIKQKIRDRISTAYNEAVEEFLNINMEKKSDHIFMRIAEKITPNTVDDRNKKPVQDAVFVLMAYYFSTCDIFKSPPEQG
ncbi:hypothetical protein KA005_77510 [bacterium]|nr:hypothetical protein [bacterium]